MSKKLQHSLGTKTKANFLITQYNFVISKTELGLMNKLLLFS